MAKAISTISLIVLLNILVGCGDADNSKLMLVSVKETSGGAPVVQVAEAGETDIVEQMMVNRDAYRKGLEALADYYSRGGNNMKLNWAKKELEALDSMPHYRYVVDAALAGPNLKPTDSIPEADQLYREASDLEDRARSLGVLVDGGLMRQALDNYNLLIKKYPTSNKIVDAAYKAAGIYEHFEDYSVAILYYQRVFQWDPATAYPAVFKMAYILDRKLHRYNEALELYQQAVSDEKLAFSYKTFAETRIQELTLKEKMEPMK
jgi:tetratricopeptide (TPR) repeat protein